MPSRNVALAVRHRDALIATRRVTSRRVRLLWDNLGSYRDEDVARFTGSATGVVAAGQRRAVSLTAAYLGRLSGSPVRGLNFDTLTGAAVRNGTDPVDVYTRPFVQLWTALGNGTPYSDAVAAAGARVEGTAATDVSLSMRASAEDAAAEFEQRVIGWERVLDPDACAFCAAASTQRYKSALLEGLHTNCQCGVAPVFRDDDRSIRDFNKQVLGNIKDANAGRDRPYWEARHFRVDGQTGEVILPDVAVHEHGELGAVLTDAAHDFTGPGDIAA